MHQYDDEHDPLPDEPAAGWCTGAGVALAEPDAEAFPADEAAQPDPDHPPAVREEPDAARRRTSTSSLGGSFASVIFHLWLVVMLASLTIDYRVPPPAPVIDTNLLHEEEAAPDPELVPKFELANPNDKELPVSEAAEAMSVGQLKSVAPRLPSASLTGLQDGPALDVASISLPDLPEGREINERIAVKGTTGDAMVTIESALDRVTWEIANHLLDHKTLVVWLLDASGSLKEQRALISARLRRIYGELGALEQAGRVVARADEALLSGVVLYGEKTTFVTPEPTDNFEKIQDAVKNAPTDASGVENVFGAVDQVVHRWQKYRTSNGRSILLVIVTDETGDDFERLEPAILTCKRYGAKAYVIGPPAVFGRRQAFVPYRAPEDGKTYQLPVDLGPESYALEVPVLPFWFGGQKYDFMSAGMGPYGLSRLVRESGGVYFLTGMTTSAAFSQVGVFDPPALKPFEPDYSFATPQEYINDINRHRLRQTVMHAAELSLKYKAGPTPNLEFRVTPQNFMQQLSEAQKSVAETTYMVDNMLAAFSGNLEPEYLKESSPRWRANYNLTLGRLLALKVRALEYNLNCANLKQLGTGDVTTKTNHWIFKPGRTLAAGAASRKMAAEAQRLLKRVVDDAPNTPWELLALRELSIPFGFEVVHKFDPPPKPAEQKNAPATPGKKAIQLADDTKPKKYEPPKPPPPPPKLPKL